MPVYGRREKASYFIGRVNMFKTKETLYTDAEFNLAIMLQTQIAVCKNSQLHDAGGLIEGHTKVWVTINGRHYIKGMYEFIVR